MPGVRKDVAEIRVAPPFPRVCLLLLAFSSLVWPLAALPAACMVLKAGCLWGWGGFWEEIICMAVPLGMTASYKAK